jgi:predicted Fe-Mo cluster-binding NifX family protein
MRWEDIILEVLKDGFDDKAFRSKDAMLLLGMRNNYSKGTVYRALHDLVKARRIERLGRGTYKVCFREVTIPDRLALSDKVIVTMVPGSSEEAKKVLRNRGVEFMMTGPALFYRYIHNLPRRLIELVYVIKGAGELAVLSLREAGMRALLNPTRSDVTLALENFSERDIFVVREFSELLGNVDGTASLERALVDLYFETTRNRIPFPEEETARIFLKVTRNEPVSHSRMLLFANRRGIRKEIHLLLDFVQPMTSSSSKVKNKHVNDFLKTMEAVEWR